MYIVIVKHIFQKKIPTSCTYIYCSRWSNTLVRAAQSFYSTLQSVQCRTCSILSRVQHVGWELTAVHARVWREGGRMSWWGICWQTPLSPTITECAPSFKVTWSNVSTSAFNQHRWFQEPANTCKAKPLSLIASWHSDCCQAILLKIMRLNKNQPAQLLPSLYDVCPSHQAAATPGIHPQKLSGHSTQCSSASLKSARQKKVVVGWGVE